MFRQALLWIALAASAYLLVRPVWPQIPKPVPDKLVATGKFTFSPTPLKYKACSQLTQKQAGLLPGDQVIFARTQPNTSDVDKPVAISALASTDTIVWKACNLAVPAGFTTKTIPLTWVAYRQVK